MLLAGNLEEVERQFHLIQVTGQKHCRCIIPQAVTQSILLLRMGEIIARNMLS